MMNNFKVIGGSWDGKVLTASHTEVLAVHVAPFDIQDRPQQTVSNDLIVNGSVTERYVIRHYRFEQGSIRIWALESLTEYEVFKRLVDNYGS